MHFPIVIRTFLLSTLASAHFQLNYPNSLGFNEDIEPMAPCGGENIVFAANDTSVSVNGFPVALLTEHPQGNFTYRGTLDKQAPFTWTNLLAVTEMGIGSFCFPNIKVPSNWTGSDGLIQIIGDLPDGTLYQCAAVKFVSGAATTVDSNTCKNSTITATVIPTGTATTSTGASGSTTSSTSTASPSGAASSMKAGALAAGLGAAMVMFVGL